MKKSVRLVVLMLCVLMAASYCYAAKVTTVLGIIESVTDDSIEVRGRYYDVSKANLTDSSGKKLPKAYLKTGGKVEIFFEDGILISVLVYEYVVE